MKNFLVVIAMTFPVLGISATKKLSCEQNNIQIEIETRTLGSIRYKFEDIKRKAKATFQSSSYTFNGSSEGDFISLEMYPVSESTYTAVFEDYGQVVKASVGQRGIPLTIMFEDQDGYETHTDVDCTVVK